MAGAAETASTQAFERWTEPAHTLEGPVPRPLGMADQLALWGNLGVSLGPVGALFVLAPAGVAPLSLAAAFTAVVVGTKARRRIASAAKYLTKPVRIQHLVDASDAQLSGRLRA